MCGIFAAIDTKRAFSDDDLRAFRSSLELIRYRGPDATGEASFCTGPGSAPNLYLGHNRLSIIDLSPEGNQPLMLNDVVIVFNGEIFNYIELRQELEQKGWEFKTRTDTEVIIKVYKEYGEKGFDRFNGMWAFILYDIKERKIVVSKDRFSIKPLYYFEREGRLYFASEMKQLLAFQVRTEINESKILSFLQQSLLNFDNETFYKGIYKVPAKCNWVIDARTWQRKEEQYWKYAPSGAVINEEEALARFRDLFAKSIELRLRGDVKVGSLLSGGLDSSAITLLANKFDPGFRSFSAAFEDERYSEEKHVRYLKDVTGIHNTTWRFSASEVMARASETAFHQEQPFVSFSVVCQDLLFSKIRKETDVVCLLCGQGADEILMGYLKYFYFVLNNDIRKLRLAAAGSNILGSFANGTALRQFNFSYAKRYLPFMRSQKQNYMLKRAELQPLGASPDLSARQMMDIDFFSVPILNHYEDRNSMAHSLEVRLPFLDHHLVEFCLDLPNSLKIRNGWTKYILRKSMPELPERIAWRKDKQGFVTPEKEWLRNEMREDVLKTMNNSALHKMGILNKTIFLHEYEKYVNGSKALVSYEEMERVYITEMWLKYIQL